MVIQLAIVKIGLKYSYKLSVKVCGKNLLTPVFYNISEISSDPSDVKSRGISSSRSLLKGRGNNYKKERLAHER